MTEKSFPWERPTSCATVTVVTVVSLRAGAAGKLSGR